MADSAGPWKELYTDQPWWVKFGLVGGAIVLLVKIMTGGGGRANPQPYYGGSDVYVSPYPRSDGTQVGGHYRTRADETKRNNFSQYPNVNPYTGEPGRRKN